MKQHEFEECFEMYVPGGIYFICKSCGLTVFKPSDMSKMFVSAFSIKKFPHLFVEGEPELDSASCEGLIMFQALE